MGHWPRAKPQSVSVTFPRSHPALASRLSPALQRRGHQPAPSLEQPPLCSAQLNDARPSSSRERLPFSTSASALASRSPCKHLNSGRPLGCAPHPDSSPAHPGSLEQRLKSPTPRQSLCNGSKTPAPSTAYSLRANGTNTRLRACSWGWGNSKGVCSPRRRFPWRLQDS